MYSHNPKKSCTFAYRKIRKQLTPKSRKGTKTMKKSIYDKVTSLIDQAAYEARKDALDTVIAIQLEKYDAIDRVLTNGLDILETTSGNRRTKLSRQRQKLYLKMSTLNKVIIETINLKRTF